MFLCTRIEAQEVMEKGNQQRARLGFRVNDHILIYILPHPLRNGLTFIPAAHIGSDKRGGSGTENISELRLVLRAGRLGRGLRPKSTARAAGILRAGGVRTATSVPHKTTMAAVSTSLSEEGTMDKLKTSIQDSITRLRKQ